MKSSNMNKNLCNSELKYIKIFIKCFKTLSIYKHFEVFAIDEKV